MTQVFPPDQLFTTQEAIQWIKENQAKFNAPNSTLKCVGVHLERNDKTLHVFSLNYSHRPNKILNDRWCYHVDCFSNHYLLPLNAERWVYDQDNDFTEIDEEFLYTPEYAKVMSYRILDLAQIEGQIGRNIMKLVHPSLQQVEEQFSNETDFLYRAIRYIEDANYPDDYEPFHAP